MSLYYKIRFRIPSDFINGKKKNQRNYDLKIITQRHQKKNETEIFFEVLI